MRDKQAAGKHLALAFDARREGAKPVGAAQHLRPGRRVKQRDVAGRFAELLPLIDGLGERLYPNLHGRWGGAARAARQRVEIEPLRVEILMFILIFDSHRGIVLRRAIVQAVPQAILSDCAINGAHIG